MEAETCPCPHCGKELAGKKSLYDHLKKSCPKNSPYFTDLGVCNGEEHADVDMDCTHSSIVLDTCNADPYDIVNNNNNNNASNGSGVVPAITLVHCFEEDNKGHPCSCSGYKGHNANPEDDDKCSDCKHEYRNHFA